VFHDGYHTPESWLCLCTSGVLLLLFQLRDPLNTKAQPASSVTINVELIKGGEPTCLRSSFLRAISAAFSSLVIPAVLGGDAGEATGDVARTLVAGEAWGVPRGLGEGESAATREDRAA